MAAATTRIYIDAYTGSWGEADGLVILNVTDEGISLMSDMSESQIRRFAADKLGATDE
jgi:hypothetical protein